MSKRLRSKRTRDRWKYSDFIVQPDPDGLGDCWVFLADCTLRKNTVRHKCVARLNKIPNSGCDLVYEESEGVDAADGPVVRFSQEYLDEKIKYLRRKTPSLPGPKLIWLEGYGIGLPKKNEQSNKKS